MRKNTILYLLLIVLCFVCNSQNANLRYEKNLGQWNDNILYKANFTQGKIYLLQNKINVIIFDSLNKYYHPHNSKKTNLKSEKYNIFSIQPYNANFEKIISNNQFVGYTNYFISNNSEKWKSNVPAYQTVTYKNVYSNVDWEISSEGKFMKHSYIVHPNGDTKIIKTLYKGVKYISIKGNNLIIETFNGNIEEKELFVYQKENNNVVQIPAEYLIERTREGFLVSYRIEKYDKEKVLIIDPSLEISTYSGAHSDNWGMTSCYDRNGLIISGGIVRGDEYPLTEGSYDSTYSDNWDCVITKYDKNGENMIFSTFLGGTYCEMPHSMTINNNNEIVIFGTTGSGDFPITDNAFQNQLAGGEYLNYEQSLLFADGIDIFIATLNSKGTDLLASTFVGGSENDGFNFKPHYEDDSRTLYDGNDSLYANFGDCARGEVVTDNDNNVYIASCTFSKDFPTTTNSYQTSFHGNQSAIVFKMDKSLTSMIYSTFIGGSKEQAAYSLDLDSMQRVFVCGGTTSENFPTTPNAYKTNFQGGTTDAFLCGLSPDGSFLEYSTFFGSNEYDQAFFIRLDKESNPYIFGQTKAYGSTLIYNANYAIPNSGQFVAKFSTDLNNLKFSTVFGSGDGMINISPSGFAVDVCNRIYCAGWGRVFKYNKNRFGYNSLGCDNLETTSDAYMTQTDGMDFYIMSMSADASSLDYATFFGEYDSIMYWGNDHVDGGTSRFDRYGAFYLTICASCNGSQNLPTTPNAFSSSNNADNCNMASVKLLIHNDFAVSDFSFDAFGCVNNEIEFKNHSRGENFIWDFGDNSPKSTQYEPKHIYTKGGEYIITLISTLSYGCKMADTLTKKIYILDNKADTLDTIAVCENKPINIGIDNLSINENEQVTFSWSPKELLSDANIINPYATITSSTWFRLIIKAQGCEDTLYRYVALEKMKSEIPDTLEYCTIPFLYSIENSLQRSLQCAWDKDFTQPIAMYNNNSSVIIKDFGDKYLYIKYSQNGCTDIDSVYLKFTGIKFDIQTIDIGCDNINSGSAKITIHNPTENTHVQWSNGQEDILSIDNLVAGMYSVKVFRDEDSCYSEVEFEIRILANLNISFTTKDATCNSICNGEIVANVTGGDAPYTYLWNTLETQSTIINLCNGIYTLTVTDNEGCKKTDSVEVKNVKNVQTLLSATENHCQTGCSAKITSQTNGGDEPYRYLWSDNSTNKDLIDACNGDYFLIVQDVQGCKDSASITVTYTDVMQNFSASIDKPDIYDGEEILLSSTYLEDFFYYWTPSMYLQTPNQYSTKGTAYENTTYTVTATDSKGCTVSDTVSVKVEFVNCDKPNIFVPNAFSPNNDGKNDVIYVSGEYIDSMDWVIYNRWGEKVFQSKDINEGWDGKYRNQDCQAGVYYYKLEIKCSGGKTFLSGGDITLIR